METKRPGRNLGVPGGNVRTFALVKDIDSQLILDPSTH